MKQILITGANSYIGTSFATYMEQWPEGYQVHTLDMLDDSWRSESFTGYDCVLHVAGIAHRRESEENAPLYYAVNRDLAIEVGKKARAEGVKTFIFLSSMSVYGLQEGCIRRDTPTCPVTHYGKSKLEGEQGLLPLKGEDFCVAILRPPMVYGEGCKGNYQALVKLARLLPLFPEYENRRSMIHIDRLCGYIKELVDCPQSGIMLPQDEEYVCTCKMVQEIAGRMGKRLVLWKGLNPLVWLAKKCTTAGKKAFGDLYYEREE